jgi:hypothetical protein
MELPLKRDHEPEIIYKKFRYRAGEVSLYDLRTSLRAIAFVVGDNGGHKTVFNENIAMEGRVQITKRHQLRPAGGLTSRQVSEQKEELQEIGHFHTVRVDRRSLPLHIRAVVKLDELLLEPVEAENALHQPFVPRLKDVAITSVVEEALAVSHISRVVFDLV